MRNREDPTQRAQELTLAAGAASLLLSTMVNRVADKRLREREATPAEEAERWTPTEAELQALRHRFIEHQALDAAGLSAWRPFREHWAVDLIGAAPSPAWPEAAGLGPFGLRSLRRNTIPPTSCR